MSFEIGWYPVALSKDLEPGSSTGARLFDRELCIWRDSDGNAHAWEDRCPHRGMRLSFGFVRGLHIACLYHGWRYDAQGRCRLIPSHPDLDVPATIRVAKYGCTERLGMVWVYSDRTVEAPPDLPIGPRETVPVRSLYVNRAPDDVVRTLGAELQSLGSQGVALLSVDTDGQRLISGIQPVGREKTALHIVLSGASITQDRVARHAAAAWSEELRRSLEEEPEFTIKRPTAKEVAL